MKKSKYILLMSVFLLTACQKTNTNIIKVISIFNSGGSDLNYAKSYEAGINFAIENLGDKNGLLQYKNIDPLVEAINFGKMDAIIGSLSKDVNQEIIGKRAQIPLISSKNVVFSQNYQKNTNLFPLGLERNEEIKTLTRLIANESVIVISNDEYYEEYADELMDELASLDKVCTPFQIHKDTQNYENIVKNLLEEKEQQLILILNKTDYTSVLFNLIKQKYDQDIIIPYYLAQHGILPPNYTNDAFALLYLTYQFLEIEESLLFSAFTMFVNTEKYVNNYCYFRDGYIAYEIGRAHV